MLLRGHRLHLSDACQDHSSNTMLQVPCIAQDSLGRCQQVALRVMAQCLYVLVRILKCLVRSLQAGAQVGGG